MKSETTSHPISAACPESTRPGTVRSNFAAAFLAATLLTGLLASCATAPRPAPCGMATVYSDTKRIKITSTPELRKGSAGLECYHIPPGRHEIVVGYPTFRSESFGNTTLVWRRYATNVLTLDAVPGHTYAIRGAYEIAIFPLPKRWIPAHIVDVTKN